VSLEYWKAENELSKFINVELESFCPHCQKHVIPEIILTNKLKEEIEVIHKIVTWEILYRCTNSLCKKLYIAVYDSAYSHSSSYGKPNYTHRVSVIPQRKKIVPVRDEVFKVSAKFYEIYKQAIQAEELGLDEICGMGYRKALEFLIKDFSIFLKDYDPNVIKDVLPKPISQVIKQYIDSERIKEFAEKAIWLGNDETHYVKYHNKDIEDLKILIELTINRIVDEVLFKKYSTEIAKRK
jgi:hypothetical protein